MPSGRLLEKYRLWLLLIGQILFHTASNVFHWVNVFNLLYVKAILITIKELLTAIELLILGHWVLRGVLCWVDIWRAWALREYLEVCVHNIPISVYIYRGVVAYYIAMSTHWRRCSLIITCWPTIDMVIMISIVLIRWVQRQLMFIGVSISGNGSFLSLNSGWL